jgi:hypothetical protein
MDRRDDDGNRDPSWRTDFWIDISTWRLSRLREVLSNEAVNVSALVNTTKDLLQGEHAAWTER